MDSEVIKEIAKGYRKPILVRCGSLAQSPVDFAAGVIDRGSTC